MGAAREACHRPFQALLGDLLKPEAASPIDISILTTGHFIALQREEIQLHPPERQHKLP